MDKPNILIFMTDQQRACSVLPGDPYKAITPALDAFREEAMLFRRAYGPSPHCCPARASFMTGLMPTQHGVWHNVCVANAISRGLKDHVRPWSVDLKDAGYRMLFAGKWHVSNFQQPRDYGWEHIFPESMCHGEGLTLEAQEAEARERKVRHLERTAAVSRTGARAQGEIRREGLTPYIHYGTSDEPLLRPYFVGGDDENPFKDKTVVDASLEKLKERGEYENTLILYISDHGDYLGDHGLWCKGLPSFLSCYHVPAIMKLPGQSRGAEHDELISLCDFAPTFLEAAGVEPRTTFAGTSLLSLNSDLCPPTSDSWRDALFFQSNGNETYGIQRSILTDPWRFVYNGFDYDELYDLESDPGQMTNLASDPAYDAVKRELYTRIWEFGIEHGEQLVNDYIMTALADYGPGLAV